MFICIIYACTYKYMCEYDQTMCISVCIDICLCVYICKHVNVSVSLFYQL